MTLDLEAKKIKGHFFAYFTSHNTSNSPQERPPKANIWFADPDGLGTPGYGLCMSAEDMAKIGLLCLNKGIYAGK